MRSYSGPLPETASWGVKFRRQHPIGCYVVDFFCSEAALVVEIDGPIHEGTVEEDAQRQAFIEAADLRFLRFTSEEVMTNLPSILQAIREAFTTSRA